MDIKLQYVISLRCDQLETPEEAKKRGGYKAVVNREVTRIITPGTIIEEYLIVAKMPNYLISVVTEKNQAANCYLDLSISEISIIEIPKDEIINEITRLALKEVLLSKDFRSSELSNLIIKAGFCITYQVNNIDPDQLTPKQALEELYKLQNLTQK